MLSFSLLNTVIKDILIKYKKLLKSKNYDFPNGSKEYVFLQIRYNNREINTTLIIDYDNCVLYTTNDSGSVKIQFLNTTVSYKTLNYIISTIIEDMQLSQRNHADIQNEINNLIHEILKQEYLFVDYMMNNKIF